MKKTITSVTALGVLVASTPVYAMPIEVNELVKGLVNPSSTAQVAADPMNVFTSFTKSNDDNSGNGSVKNPYNRFEDAIANVQDGGTIYIDSEAFLNDIGGNLPFLIDKNVTIKPSEEAKNASLSVRSAGIILGANVKFENISLNFANKHHDSIFANGHTLDLINVTRNSSSREIDLFAGGLHIDGQQVHPSGNNGVINVETNGNFNGGNEESKFGNIYAGSMNGAFNGNAEINVSRKDNSKKLIVGEIKASGALEADAGGMLDVIEPLPPQADSTQFPMNGNVTINLDNYQVAVDGTTGSEGVTNVTTSTVYPNDLALNNVNGLTVNSGQINVVDSNVTSISNITLGSGAILDLTKAGKDFTVDNYNGDGIVILSKDGKLNVANQMNGSIELQTEGATKFNNGLVEEGHVYITTPNEDAVISFEPNFAQEELELIGIKNGDLVEWTIKEIGAVIEPPTNEDEEEETPEVNVSEPIYLSDLQHITNKSNAWGGHIKKNQSHAGNKITLIVDGERVQFDKGMSAHAPSNLVYDISEYSSEYTRLVTYMGIDAVQGGNGNGVYFVISTSENGTDWTEVKTTGVVKGNSESIYVELELNGAKFIKLHANDNGGNGNDHATYGGLRLVKEDYSLSSKPIEGLKTVAEYDEILKNSSISENIINNKMIILQRAFVNKVGYEALQRLASRGEIYAEGIDYLMTNETALNYMMTSGAINKYGSYSSVVRHFAEILDEHGADFADTSDDNFNLRLAISIALGYSNSDMTGFWIISKKDKSAPTRYNTYQKLVESGKMDLLGNTNDHRKWSTKEFKDLPIPLMKWVVDARINDDEFDWLADYSLSEKAKGKNNVDAYNYIKYGFGYNYENPELFDEANKQMYNDKYGNFTKYYDDYGTPNVFRLWQIFEEGAVCGGLTHVYSNLAEVSGRPSSPSSQPAHAAALTYAWNKENQRYEWVIQNNITGWVHTANQYEDRLLGWGNQSWTHWNGGGVYTVLASDAITDENYEQVALLNLLSDSYTGSNEKEVYEQMLQLQPKNLDAIEGLINIYLNDETKTSTDYFNLAQRIVEGYTYFPRVMMEALALIEGKITNSSESARLDVLKYNTLIKASNATPDVSSNVGMSKQTANEYLGEQSNELATFSFSGDKANTIVLNSKYEGSEVRLRYSLDGGTTWTDTDSQEVLLTEDELATITAENDIIVGLVGATDDFNYTIDILEGVEIDATINTVLPNDYEDLFLGNVEHLEFSLDYGQTWCDYVTGQEDTINPNGMTGIRFTTGDEEWFTAVMLRYKANGTRLQSATKEYGFMPSKDTDTKKYVQLRHVNIVEAPQHQGGREPQKMIDGDANSGFHTTFNTTTEDKFITVEFDKPKYISHMDYVFGGSNNGRMKSGTIQASMDGENWEVIKTFKDMPRDKSVQGYEMDMVVKAKYIKLVADETHGNIADEANMYLSASELRFYEDTTKTEEVTPEEVEPDVEGWLKTKTLEQVAYLWDYEVNEETNTVTLNKLKGDNAKAKSGDVKVEIPREIEGKRVELADLSTETFEGVTHIKIAEGEGQVKLLATDINKGFLNNEILKSVELEGLDVSEVTDMTMLFSGCVNLQVINLLGWDIQEDAITTAMFYISKDATNEQKKILVISDSYKLREYNFEQSNRLSYIVRFSANGGHFFDKEDDILNMTFGHYIVHTDVVEELGHLYNLYVERAGEPTYEGYEFKGWYTDDETPTNVYELLSMTYKATWEKIEEDGEDTTTPDSVVPEVKPEPTPPVTPELPEVNNPVEPQPPTTTPDTVVPELPPADDNVGEDEEEDGIVATFIDKVKEIVTNAVDTIEDKIEKFKDLLTIEGVTDVDNTSDDVYGSTIHEIKVDIESSENKYTTLDAIKDLIQSIKETFTGVVLPDDVPVDTTDTPTTLPDDVPVDADDIPTILPDDVPVEEDKTDTDHNDKPQPTPPASGGGGSGGATVQPPSTENAPINGIENLKDLDKQLQEKVDTIIAESVVENQGLVLNIIGDSDDMSNINHVEVTKDGIFAVVDSKKLKFAVTLDGLDLDLTNARVVRVNPTRNSIMNYSAVPYKNTKDGLKIMSNNLENILITSKASEPFVDVNDTDWFKVDIEEAYNYGFTQGTSATTYNPYGQITRGEFAVMIARALELKPKGYKVLFDDVKGKWYQNEVQALQDVGIIYGFKDGTFGGDKTITRQEAATFITRMLSHMNVDVTVANSIDFIDIDEISAFAKDSVQYLASQDVLVGGGDNKFNPTNNLTRAEMAKVLVHSLKLSDWY